jgi:hypothetical protein
MDIEGEMRRGFNIRQHAGIAQRNLLLTAARQAII